MAVNLLADSIRDVPQFAAFDALFANRFEGMAEKLDNLLVYIISNVSSQVLPYLAEQFDIATDPLYMAAATDDQRRAAIAQAIQLKRYIGTVYAIKQAIAASGLPGATLVEGINTGDPSTDWARFAITVPLLPNQGINTVASQNLLDLINRYKNKRSWLIGGVTYLLNLVENDVSAQFNDQLTINEGTGGYSDSIDLSSFYYNGHYKYDGSNNYSDPHDVLIINIINH